MSLHEKAARSGIWYAAITTLSQGISWIFTFYVLRSIAEPPPSDLEATLPLPPATREHPEMAPLPETPVLPTPAAPETVTVSPL